MAQETLALVGFISLASGLFTGAHAVGLRRYWRCPKCEAHRISSALGLVGLVEVVQKPPEDSAEVEGAKAGVDMAAQGLDIVADTGFPLVRLVASVVAFVVDEARSVTVYRCRSCESEYADVAFVLPPRLGPIGWIFGLLTPLGALLTYAAITM